MVMDGEVGMCLTREDPWETSVRQIGLLFKDNSSVAFFIVILYLQSLTCVCSIASCSMLRANWEGTVCYNSCPSCDPTNSCEWTSCYDDVAYTMALLDKVEIVLDVIKAQHFGHTDMMWTMIVAKSEDFWIYSPVWRVWRN